MSAITVCPVCLTLYDGSNEHPRDPCRQCWGYGYRVDPWGNITIARNHPRHGFFRRNAVEVALLVALTILALLAWSQAADASTTKRSTKARADFQRAHPCPATGKPRGPCPGYVIDHIEPLCAGGPDTPANMQWQTAAKAREKDKLEAAQCKAARKAQ